MLPLTAELKLGEQVSVAVQLWLRGFITDPAVVHKILNHLHLPADDLPRSPPCIPSDPEPFEQMTLEPLDPLPADKQDLDLDPFPSRAALQRAPPWEPGEPH